MTSPTTSAAASVSIPTKPTNNNNSKPTTESTQLTSNARSLLHPPNPSRTNLTSGVISRRCASYTPTLSELKSTTFEEYIRGEVLGVPLPGYEFLYIYEDKEGGREMKRVVPVGQVAPPLSEQQQPRLSSLSLPQRQKSSKQQPQTPRQQHSSEQSVKMEKVELQEEVGVVVPPTTNDEKDGGEDASATTTTTSAADAAPSEDATDATSSAATATATADESTTAVPTTSSSTSASPLSKEKSIDHSAAITPTSTTAKSNTPTTTPTPMMTRSRTKATSSSAPPSSSSTSKTTKNTSSPSSKKQKESNTYQPKKYQMCWYKLRDGIAKVSLPQGFHSKLDATARGRHWAKGSKLGDMIIPSPIKQAISGIGGVYEYTLLEQPSITVSQFRTLADEYRKRQLGSEFDVDQSDEVCDELARKFWRRLGPTMEPPIYGADMEGTLFNKDAYACGWNVNRLESCLCLLRADVKDGEGGGGGDDEEFHLPGVTSAYLYFGMWASAFAAHTEDMNLLSINYLHAGSPKYWYGIAREDSKRFESLAQSHFVGRASECSEFLRHKRCLLSPAILRKAGIRFTTCVQRPGDAIITFPGSYHFGFNTGFNIAESTNFAVPEWIPLGMQADICMCHPHSVRIQMDRVKSLLESYEKDMHYRELKGMTELTYSNWAKQEAKRLKKNQRESSSSSNNKQQNLTSNGMNTLTLSTMKKINNTSFAVEITNETYTTLLPKKSKKKRQLISTNEWRVAKRGRPGLFVPSTSVICMVECDDEVDDDETSSFLSVAQNDDNEFEFFIGTIVKLVDGYVKVHFVGLTKKDDLWFEQSSDRIFLDGGVTTLPSSVGNEKAGKRKKNRE
ncbi:hypothetical protein ACHAXH_007854 [Discostella pseudostelligera]